MSILYNAPIPSFDCRLTQLVSVLKYNFNCPLNYRLNYTKLIQLHMKMLQNNPNQIVWEMEHYIFKHTINWVLYESGASSLFINIFCNGKKIASTKIYVNLKIIMFYYDISHLTKLRQSVPKFVQEKLLENPQTHNSPPKQTIHSSLGETNSYEK